MHFCIYYLLICNYIHLYAYAYIYMQPLHIYDYVNIMHVSAYICTAHLADDMLYNVRYKADSA